MRLDIPTFATVSLAALLAAGPTTAPLAAQDLMLAGGLGSSAFTELGAPVSVALHGRIPLTAWEGLWVVLGGRFARDTGEEVGVTCASYWPENAGCVEEPIARDAQLIQLEVGLGTGLGLGPHLELRGAILGAQTLLAAGSEGVETGRSAGNYYPQSTHRGLAAMGEVAWRGLTDRLGLVGRVRTQALDFRGCVTDMGTPFCGEERLLTYEIGMTFVPGRDR